MAALVNARGHGTPDVLDAVAPYVGKVLLLTWYFVIF